MKKVDFSKFLQYPIEEEKLLLILPLFFLLGDWILPAVFIVFCFVILLFNKSLSSFKNLKITHFFLWSSILVWGFGIALKSPVVTLGLRYYVGTIVIPFLLYQIIFNITVDERFLSRLFNCFIFLGTIMGIYSIWIFVTSGFSTSLRIPSLWNVFNIVAAIFMIIFFFNLSVIINNRKNKYVVVYYFTLIVILFGLFLTQTRGVWMATSVALVFYFVKRPKLIIPASMVFGILFLLFYGVILDRFLSVKNFTYDLSSLGRLQAWLSSVILIKKNFLWGYGFDAYIHLRDTVFSAYFVNVMHSHNTYLRAILEMGFIGFALYFSLYFYAFYSTFAINKMKIVNRLKIYTDALQLSFIGLSISFMFEPYMSLYGVSTLIIWVLISLSIKLRLQLKDVN